MRNLSSNPQIKTDAGRARSLSTQILLGAFVLALAAPSHGQSQASEVSDEHIAIYKSGILRGCRDEGRRRGDPVENVDAFCSCMINTLTESVSRAEWQQAFFHTVRKEHREEMLVMKPHIHKVGVCKRTP